MEVTWSISAAPADVGEVAQLLQDAAAEAFEPRRPAASSVRHGEARRAWVARDAQGCAVGCATLIERANDDYTGIGKIHIVVRPALRRQGLGTLLLQRLTAEAGLHTVYGWAPEFSAGHGFLAARLDRPRSEEVWSVLDLDRCDRPTAAEPPGLATVAWPGPCPQGLLDGFVAAHVLLQIGPRGSELGAERLTPVLLAELEAVAATRGERWLTVCVRDRSTGEVAGFTQLTVPPAQHVGEQEFTGVVPAWRRRGLGAWLKVAMLAELRREHPGVRFVVTQNAAGNVPMLAINQRLGFRAYQRLVAWEKGC